MVDHKLDVSIIVTAHSEGILAHRTIRSVVAAINHAREQGITSELVIVQDRPTDETVRYFEHHAPDNARLMRTDFGDAGLARNYGANLAAGKYLALTDADDLICRTWLSSAFNYAEQSHLASVVWHPQFGIYFQSRHIIQSYLSSDDASFRWLQLVDRCPWTCHIFANRNIILETPFESSHEDGGFGCEEWHWFCNLLHKGIVIRVVDGTSVYIRQNEFGASLKSHNAATALIPHTPLLEPNNVSARCSNILDAGGERTENRLSDRQGSWFRNGLKHVLQAVPPAYSMALSLYNKARMLREHQKNRVHSLPDFLIGQLNDMHLLEPQLRADRHTISWYCWYQPSMSAVGTAYVKLCQKCPASISHVLVVPGLKRGGADLETLNYIELLHQLGFAETTVVLATHDSESPWADRLPSGVTFVNFGRATSNLTDDESDFVLGTLLVQMQSDVIHLLNSQIGYRVFRKYGQVLSQYSRLFASVFCEDVTAEGRSVGRAIEDLPFCFDKLTGVFCDNRSFLDRLYSIYAFDKDKLFLHYQPIQTPSSIKQSHSQKNELSILWASRLARQKRPDLLYQIAVLSKKRPFHFHVYGNAFSPSERKWVQKLSRLSNVEVHGAFNNLNSLKTDEFDVFLYTSQWDGLPNVLLEAMAAGLPAIASDVGGIHELIEHEETGLLVQPFDDACKYVAALEKLLSDQSCREQLAKKARAIITSRHTWNRFQLEVCQIGEYVLGKQADR